MADSSHAVHSMLAQRDIGIAWAKNRHKLELSRKDEPC